MVMTTKLKISEIYLSIQGEGPRQGLPCQFIRLAGCRYRCRYCDTPYALAFKGVEKTVEEISQTLKVHPVPLVCVTGGEPLHHPHTPALLKALVKEGYEVWLETAGLDSIAMVPPEVHIIMDIKTPGSGLPEPYLPDNLRYLQKKDAVKFVIVDKRDFDWAVEKVKALKLLDLCPVFFSPSYRDLNPTNLAEWILETQLSIRLNLQIHKFLWGEVPGR